MSILLSIIFLIIPSFSYSEDLDSRLNNDIQRLSNDLSDLQQFVYKNLDPSSTSQTTNKTQDTLSKFIKEKPFWLNNLELNIENNARNLEDYNKNIISLKNSVLEQLKIMSQSLESLKNQIEDIEKSRNTPIPKIKKPLKRPITNNSKHLKAPTHPPSYRKFALQQRNHSNK